ncbi:MAG: HesA/MoeB/ThiF family protein [Aggregatilineales bacterium]
MSNQPTSTDWDRVARYLGSEAFQHLSQKKVAVIGVGSGGGFAALALAMSGVGQFVLIDPDQVSPANVVRHVADGRYVGQSKAKAVAELIQHRNPAAQANVLTGQLEDFPSALDDVDLVVVGVDDEQPKYAINEACRARGLTAVYAGVYERGEGGDVAVIHPDHGPCYACWALSLREGVIEQGPGEIDLDYGQARPDGTFAAEPGLWLHVVRVAAAQADMALNELLRCTSAYRELPSNTVILANTAMEILTGITAPPHSAQWLDIARDPNCLVCGQAKGDVSESLSLDALTGGIYGSDTDTEA